MSLIPAFELGLWNAWVFMVPALLMLFLRFPVMMKKGAPGGPTRVPCKSKVTLLVATLSKIIFFPAVIYSVFLPLQLESIWFYVGLPITLTGLVGIILVLVDWAITPAGQPVTRGIYRYSRHPMYVAMVLLLLGVSMDSVSRVFLLFAIITVVGVTRPFSVKIEEAQCLGHYGAAYREYMDNTPRWIGMPRARCLNPKETMFPSACFHGVFCSSTTQNCFESANKSYTKWGLRELWRARWDELHWWRI